MKANIFPYFILPVLAVALSACGDDSPSPEPPTPSGPAERTVLVYMAANNNLGSNGYDLMDIKEMKEAASAGRIGDSNRLLVYHAGYNSSPVLMEVLEKGLDTLKVYPKDALSVESARMSGVFNDANEFSESNQWGLVFWSHGTGWLQDGISESPDHIQEYSFGYENARKMNVTTLARVIREAPFHPDFIYFDCCYMGSVETLYELRDVTSTIVSSPTELPVYGMPYQTNVGHLFAKPEPMLESAAKATFDYYDSQYGLDRTCTMSVVRTSGLRALAEATKAIYSAYDGKLPEDYEPQRLTNTSVASCMYFDFKDYIHNICSDETLLSAFDKAYSNTVTYNAATPMLWNAIPLDRSNGLSTYILRDSESHLKKNYSTLGWYTDVASAIKF